MSDQPSPTINIDFAKIFARVKEIVTNPTGFWPIVKTERQDIPTIYKEYLYVLAAFVPIAQLILGVYAGQGIFSALVSAGVHYGIGLGYFYCLALLVEAIAPRFNCAPTREDAFRWVAFSAFPVLAGSAFLILVPLFGVIASMLCVAAGFYSLFILWQGAPEMLGVPGEQRGPLFICIVGSVILFGLLLQAI